MAFTGTEGRTVLKQKYHIGELVCVGATSLSGRSTMKAFRVMNTYFVEERTCIYRLRQIDGPNERVVPESELRRV